MVECVFVWHDEAVCLCVCVVLKARMLHPVLCSADIGSCCLVGKMLFWVSTLFILFVCGFHLFECREGTENLFLCYVFFTFWVL